MIDAILIGLLLAIGYTGWLVDKARKVE